ncbi:MAG TPA: adenylyl-sulfate kinase [Noviherbaspirillum sp.]|uniref:adenylyl-sulfate kinase n=1 Tax=Noviherbaspirillum sp. TaxID=1926288 RepID=UPI002D67E55E|nr:adenylyl-sulfate kinase [Noviherbaspirillum sp.]HYD96494.1 adenylyl-sulfate kinase [Noviherbaspirillum sp.]
MNDERVFETDAAPDCGGRIDVTWHRSAVAAADRARLLGQEPVTVWLTGLSGAGKSTIAFELERRLIAQGRLAFVLDGDNVRHGLSRDLGFSPEDRMENIRRAAEVSKLFNDAGLLVVTAFISPYRCDRELARAVIGADRFIEIHLCTDLRVCEERDPKGLYQKVRRGAIGGFTGVSAPYEPPEAPAMRIDTARSTVEESVAEILRKLAPGLQQKRYTS